MTRGRGRNCGPGGGGGGPLPRPFFERPERPVRARRHAEARADDGGTRTRFRRLAGAAGDFRRGVVRRWAMFED